jgi:hypothetical protein
MVKVLLKLLDLLESSVIFQGTLVLLVFGGIIYLIITSQTVPDTLWDFGLIILGFFFGSKSSHMLMKGRLK